MFVTNTTREKATHDTSPTACRWDPTGGSCTPWCCWKIDDNSEFISLFTFQPGIPISCPVKQF